jgi:hypothetical protein
MQPTRFTPKLNPGQWAEARSMRAGGASCEAIARHFHLNVATVRKRALREGWPLPPGSKPRPAKADARTLPSPGTACIRSRLALRLYAVLECKIRMMELRMIRELQAHEQAGGDALPPIADERESFVALIASINQVTEMASEPATAPDGRTKSAAGSARDAINPELTALSTDIDPGGLAVASAKDNFRRDLAGHLAKLFPKP